MGTQTCRIIPHGTIKMTSLHLQEALREPGANAAPASNPEAELKLTTDATPSAIATTCVDASNHQIGADDSFWVYKPKARSASTVRDAAAAPVASAATKPRQSGLSLREAAALAGASKSTILRAIQSGRLAAPKLDTGGYAIDPAALLSAFPPKTRDGAIESSGKSGSPTAKAPASQHSAGTAVKPDVLAARMAALEVEIKSLKALLGEVNPPRTWWRRLAG
jgi:excisionase family DNA binding protein